MVVVVHASGIVAGPRYAGAHPFWGLLETGAGEVDFFFMMSGFIMVVSSHNPTTGLPRLGALEFFRRRAVRILPLLWLAVVSYAVIRYFGRGGIGDPLDYVRAFFVWPVGEVSPWVTWTIRYEVLFYLVFGCAFIAWPRSAPVGILWFVSPVLLAGATRLLGLDAPEILVFVFSPLNLEFGIGVALGFAYHRLGPPVPFRFQLTAIVAIFVVLRLIRLTGIETGSLGFVLGIAPVCLAALVLAVKTQPSQVSKTMIFLGDASYSIFLFHPHVLSAALQGLVRVAPWLPPTAMALIATAISVGLTSLVHVFVEKPLVERANMMFHTIPSFRRTPKEPKPGLTSAN